MFRALTILAAGAALAVTASPASAGSSKKPPPRTAQVIVLIGANDYGLMETNGDQLFLRGKAKAPRPGVKGFTLDIGTQETLDLNSAPKRLEDGTSNTVMFGE